MCKLWAFSPYFYNNNQSKAGCQMSVWKGWDPPLPITITHSLNQDSWERHNFFPRVPLQFLPLLPSLSVNFFPVDKPSAKSSPDYWQRLIRCLHPLLSSCYLYRYLLPVIAPANFLLSATYSARTLYSAHLLTFPMSEASLLSLWQ